MTTRYALVPVALGALVGSAVAWLASASTQRVVVANRSMLPTLVPGDRLLINRLAHRTRRVRRAEIVLFHDPERPQRVAIKRLVALPGDAVRLTATGVEVEPGGTAWGTRNPRQPLASQIWRLRPAELFVLGDNVAESRDSRHFGPVGRSALRGIAWYRYWPAHRRGFLPGAPPLPD